MALVDTGFLSALLNPRDALHARAKLLLLKNQSRLVLTEAVYFEVINQFSKAPLRHLSGFAHCWIFEGRRVEFIPSTRETNSAAWELFVRHRDKEWSLTDCVSFVIMRQRGLVNAFAHDIHFEQAGFVPLLRRDP